MKRILLFLALILGVKVNAQIVGGYLPLNSTKSFTSNTGTFKNIVVNSNSLATGILINVDQTGNQYPFIVNGGSLNANAIMSGSANARYELVNTTTAVRWYLSNNTATTGIGLDGISLGTNANPNSGFLQIGSTGNTTLTGNAKVAGTFSLGGANLTGSSTGTVAVMNDIPFMLHCMHNSNSPGDASTLYFGVPVIGLPSTTATRYTMVIPNNCTITGYDLVGVVNGTPGSAETSTLSVRVDNTTDILLSSAITYSTASGYQEFTASNLNTNINAGSVINIKWQTPTWVTNPTSVSNGIVLRFKLR
jgi:hypothetical protein